MPQKNLHGNQYKNRWRHLFLSPLPAALRPLGVSVCCWEFPSQLPAAIRPLGISVCCWEFPSTFPASLLPLGISVCCWEFPSPLPAALRHLGVSVCCWEFPSQLPAALRPLGISVCCWEFDQVFWEFRYLERTSILLYGLLETYGIIDHFSNSAQGGGTWKNLIFEISRQLDKLSLQKMYYIFFVKIIK